MIDTFVHNGHTIAKLHDFGCAVTIFTPEPGVSEYGTELWCAPLMENGDIAPEPATDYPDYGPYAWGELTDPYFDEEPYAEGRAMLDQINSIFGTTYRLEQFAGR